jgi:hypothetical protein
MFPWWETVWETLFGALGNTLGNENTGRKSVRGSTNRMTSYVMFTVIKPVDIPCRHPVYSPHMLQQSTVIPAREIVRNYQKLFKQVTEQNEPVILATKKGEKVALISLKSLDEFTRLKEEASGKALWELAQKARQLSEGKELPTDLSTRHDYYLWEAND